MPNGDDADWIRVCAAIDGFRVRYGRWPARVRLFPDALDGLREHVLTPEGFAVLVSVIELVPDASAPVVAEGAEGESYSYGREGFPPRPEEPALEWFGQAVLVPNLREW